MRARFLLVSFAWVCLGSLTGFANPFGAVSLEASGLPVFQNDEVETDPLLDVVKPEKKAKEKKKKVKKAKRSKNEALKLSRESDAVEDDPLLQDHEKVVKSKTKKKKDRKKWKIEREEHADDAVETDPLLNLDDQK